MESQISLKKFSNNLNTRSLADSIFFSENSERGLLVDFNGVESATPSFCHEMLVVLKKKKMKFKIVNANDGIKFQMQKAISSISN